jgi:hypothetical protein
VTTAETAPPQAAPLSHTGPQDVATAASAAASELAQLLQKMTGDIANLEKAMEQLRAKQDRIANDNEKAIEQFKTKQEDMARLLAKVSEQSALPKTSPPSGRTQSPQSRMRPQAPPPHRLYPLRWQRGGSTTTTNGNVGRPSKRSSIVFKLFLQNEPNYAVRAGRVRIGSSHCVVSDRVGNRCSYQ